ncbi:hypothetical protein SBRCBS47491_003405 [Sporothrix bragantina]|uniref:Uncharacterized protein n=1 Tax=Sporothrix bragantina TaxID=671064 RepID=A0ABP0BEZ6_9PEZI
MAHTSILASLNEPLLPLTDKQLQAAAESHEYAIDHELFLALDTDDHLQYHHSVAANEERRIPAAERSLAEDHLPPLVLPTTKIEELWTVSRRVADVLEAACRWLDDDELKFCEEAVVNNSARLRKARHPTSLKLEPPLLCTDPDADCAELQKLASAAVNCGEKAVDYAAQLEESVRTETMAVSEQVINSLVSLMSSMEWTEKDQAAFLEDQLTVPKLSKRYISPTLPPVELYDYYIPEGDVCLVSDASDVSSGSQDPGDTLTMPQEHVQIKAPELILGFRAFAEPSIQTDYNNNDNNNNNNNSKGAGQDAKTVLADKNIATAAAMIQNSLAVQPIDTSISHLPRAILSTAIPRAIRSILMQLLPTLDFVERDYQQQQSSNTDINNDDEADIVVSPTTGIIVITMVGLRQTDAQRRYVFQTRVASAAQKYEQLYVFIYRSHARPVSSGAANDDLPELSPSDAMAFAQLQGFVHSLPCKVSASYVGGGEQTVAQWIATLILKLAEKYGKTKSTEAYLVEEETHEERLLRQAGFNVYDAQIALGVLKASVDRPDFKDKNGKSHIRRMMEMSSDERLQLFD